MAFGPDLTLDIRSLDFRGERLFDGLRLNVPAGQVVALVGRSGVGKSTLLRIIAGAEKGFDGLVRVGESSPSNAPMPGYVFQDARLLPWLDAAENIRAVSPDISPQRIDGLLAAVGLEGQGRTFPHQLSGGMQRRLGLARALAVNSGLLLLDEPFVSLDRETADGVMGQFQRVIAAGRPTVVLVSHLAEDAARLAHRVVILAGRPAQIAIDLDLPGDPQARTKGDVAALTDRIERAATILPSEPGGDISR